MGVAKKILLAFGATSLVASLFSPIPIRVKDCNTSIVTPSVRYVNNSGFWIERSDKGVEGELFVWDGNNQRIRESNDKQRQAVNEINRVLRILEKVPDPLQITISDNWSRGGHITIEKNVEEVKKSYEFYFGEPPPDYLAGFAQMDVRQPAFLPAMADERLILHEYGHLVDAALKLSSTEEFNQLYEKEKERLENGINIHGENAFDSGERYAIRNPRDYFAEWFAVYFSGTDRLKSRMKSEYPETWQYFESFNRRARNECSTRNPKGYQLMGKLASKIIRN